MKNRRNMIEVAERLRKRNENSTPMGNENQYPFGRDPNYQNPCFGSSLDTLRKGSNIVFHLNLFGSSETPRSDKSSHGIETNSGLSGAQNGSLLQNKRQIE